MWRLITQGSFSVDDCACRLLLVIQPQSRETNHGLWGKTNGWAHWYPRSHLVPRTHTDGQNKFAPPDPARCLPIHWIQDPRHTWGCPLGLYTVPGHGQGPAQGPPLFYTARPFILRDILIDLFRTNRPVLFMLQPSTDLLETPTLANQRRAIGCHGAPEQRGGRWVNCRVWAQ